MSTMLRLHAGKRVTLVCLAVSCVGLAACGKKNTQNSEEESAPASLEWVTEPPHFDALGESIDGEVVVKDEDGEALEGVSIVWASSDPAVAEVDETGRITAVGNGEAEIEARVGELAGSLPVLVRQVATRLRIAPTELQLPSIEAEGQLQAEAWDRRGEPIEAPALHWQSSDEDVATVEGGNVVATGPGIAVVTVQAEGSEVTATAQVRVEPTVETLALELEAGDFIAGQPRVVRVLLRDQGGHLVRDADAVVRLRLGENPGRGRLLGGATARPSEGVATFSDLAIDKAGSGYTLVAEVAGLGTVESLLFDVLPGAPAQLAFAVQPQGAASGQSLGPVSVHALDAWGNTSASSGLEIRVSLDGGAPDARLAGTLEQGTVEGRATFADLEVDRVGSGYRLLAEATGMPPVRSEAFEVVAGPAAQLAFRMMPGSVRASAGMTVQVEARDLAGNPAPSFTDWVEVSLAPHPTGARLAGERRVRAVQGIATFPGLSVDLMGADYHLVATAGALLQQSPGFDVLPGDAARLAFLSQPALTARSGESLGSVEIHVLDAAGNAVPDATGVVELRLGAGAPGAQLRGPRSATFDGGIARFEGLEVDRVGSYTLLASAADLVDAQSRVFTITPGAAARLAFLDAPRAGVSNTPLAPIRVEARDLAGNPVEEAPADLKLRIGHNPAEGKLQPGSGSASGGVITFSELRIDKAGKGYTLIAEADGVEPAESEGFDIGPGAAAELRFVASPGSGVAGTTLPAAVVEIRDAAGNLRVGHSHVVRMRLGSGEGAALGGVLERVVESGKARFDNLRIDRAGAGYTLVASTDGLEEAESPPFDVAAANATHLAFVRVPPAFTAAGEAFSAEVELRDGFGNRVWEDGREVRVELAQNPWGGTLQGSLVATSSQGRAHFPALSLARAGEGYSLRARAGALVEAISPVFGIEAGEPASLAFVVQPSNRLSGTLIQPPVVVEARDAFGNASEAEGELRLALIGAGDATLEGTTEMPFQGSRASFADLSVARAGSYRLRASWETLSAESASFSILPGPAVKLSFAEPPRQGVATQFLPQVAVELQDEAGNRVSGSGVIVSLRLVAPEGATLLGGRVVASEAGLARFPELRIPVAGAGYRLEAGVSGLPALVSEAFDVVPGPAQHLVFVVEPEAESSTLDEFGAEVEVRDAAGNRIVGAGPDVALSLGRNPSGAALEGTLQSFASEGRATFSDLRVATAGSGYTLLARGEGLVSAESRLFDRIRPPAASLSFLESPEGGTVRDAFTVRVEARSAQGAALEGVEVHLAVSGGSALVALPPEALVAQSVGGVATFPDLGFRFPGEGFVLTASLTYEEDFIEAASEPFDIVVESYQEARSGLIFRRLPGGTVRMPCEAAEPGCTYDVGRGGWFVLREVQPVAFAETPVTVEAHNRCVAAGECTPVPDFWDFCTSNKSGFEDHPANCLNWHDADEFCAWSGGRLSTPEEWVFAATGGLERSYPWGDEPPNENLANFNSLFGGTTPVGSFPEGAAPWGLLDMAGNVMEWNLGEWPNDHREMRGGFFAEGDADALKVERIFSTWTTAANAWSGARCVHFDLRSEVEEKSGLVFVELPGGTFLRGCVPWDPVCLDEEKEADWNTLVAVEPFSIGQTEVTVAAYGKCVDAGACSEPREASGSTGSFAQCNWKKAGREGHPVNCVSWDQAREFCAWIGGRLPSSTEWEYAAKSGRPNRFPWGKSLPTESLANFFWNVGHTSEVGSYPLGATPWGLLDMAGNVAEWTASDASPEAIFQQLRDGGWAGWMEHLRTSAWGEDWREGQGDKNGFRCAR